MKKFLRKNRKYLCSLLLFAVVFNFALLPALTASAQTPTAPAPTPVPSTAPAPATAKDDASKADGGGLVSWFKGSAVLFISSLISSLFGSLFGIILWLEAQIIDYVLTPANFPFVDASIVQTGWRITRDLANMFFILILLVIAFATVLKIDSYAIKQLWLKTLVAALLINFSLVIVGVVIDFTQVLTTFFLNQITGGGSFGTITTRLASSMQILNFYDPQKGGILGGITQFGADSIAAAVGIILTLVGLVITVFVFGAAAIFLIIRILWIWFLLIVAPIAWMLWILPATEGYFKQWWDKFIQWSFFAPVYVFMIYLSLSIFDANGKFLVDNVNNFPVNSSQTWNTAAPGLTTVAMPAAIFQWILVIALMFGSLIIAQKFGVEGATGARKILTGWGNSTKNWTGRQLRRAALGVGAKPATGPGEEGKAKAGWLMRGAKYIAGTAIPGRRLIAGKAFNMAAGEAKTAEEAQKQFASWTPEAIQAYLQKSPGAITNAFFRNQQMGAALELKEKGKLDKLGENRIKELLAMSSQYYPKQLDELLKIAPHLAPDFDRKIEAIVSKIEKAGEMLARSLENATVATSLNPQQLKSIVQKGDITKINALKDTIEGELNKLGANIKTTIQNEILNKVDSEGRSISKDARNNSLRKLAEENPYAEKVARSKFITASPAWDI